MVEQEYALTCPCIDCILIPMCKSKFGKSKDDVYIILRIAIHCNMFYKYVDNKNYNHMKTRSILNKTLFLNNIGS